jgi:hypothetical protein
MSRSFKHQPFQAITGASSAQNDKTRAARSVRRTHRRVLHIALKSGDYDVLLPHRLGCPWNNTYSWGRDGHQYYQALDDRAWQMFLEDYTETWPPQWYTKMMRK